MSGGFKKVGQWNLVPLGISCGVLATDATGRWLCRHVSNAFSCSVLHVRLHLVEPKPGPGFNNHVLCFFQSFKLQPRPHMVCFVCFFFLRVMTSRWSESVWLPKQLVWGQKLITLVTATMWFFQGCLRSLPECNEPSSSRRRLVLFARVCYHVSLVASVCSSCTQQHWSWWFAMTRWN